MANQIMVSTGLDKDLAQIFDHPDGYEQLAVLLGIYRELKRLNALLGGDKQPANVDPPAASAPAESKLVDAGTHAGSDLASEPTKTVADVVKEVSEAARESVSAGS